MSKPHFLVFPYQLFEDERLDNIDRIVYAVLYNYENHSLKNWNLTNKDIAELCCINSSRVVANALTKLEESGYISRQYKDEAKKNRIGIRCKLAFKGVKSVSPTDDTVSPTDDTQKAKKTDDTIYNNNNILLYNNNIYNNNIINNNINNIIAEFKKLNPAVSFANKTQREAIKTLLGMYSEEVLKKLIAYAFSIANREYAPQITTPYELLNKLPKLKAFLERQKSNDILTL